MPTACDPHRTSGDRSCGGRGRHSPEGAGWAAPRPCPEQREVQGQHRPGARLPAANPTLPRTSSVTPDTLFCFSGPRFPHQYTREDHSRALHVTRWKCRLREAMLRALWELDMGTRQRLPILRPPPAWHPTLSPSLPISWFISSLSSPPPQGVLLTPGSDGFPRPLGPSRQGSASRGGCSTTCSHQSASLPGTSLRWTGPGHVRSRRQGEGRGRRTEKPQVM